ncbi:MAG TPA: dTDP-4-dehydrorhamnose 3,5-epimerase family protein [bacterium]|jgi:dTDP-4-dehydrorhamnose 3,5-epimerase-like enzyme|nr:dTDP-4-dehydrorhamnose 3,5-epimerase family protein [bacterium]
MANKSFVKPEIIEAGLAVDDRGQIIFANGFDFEGVKRFYMVKNHSANFVRAWHGHKKEGKYILCVNGAAVVGAVKVDNWNKPNAKTEVSRFVLSAKKPSILFIPPGYANGFMSLTKDTQLMFFSTSTLEQSKGDDIRFPARYWDVWRVEER